MNHLIIRINLRGLKNETHFGFNTNADRIFVRHDPEKLGIQPLYVPYKVSCGHEEEALDFIRRSKFTQEIYGKDHVRDTVNRGMVDTVDAALHHFNPVYVEAAKTIDNVLRRYGNMARKTLDDETVAIYDMLREFQQPAVAQAIVRIGLTPWVEKLADENAKFEALMTERYDEAAAKTSYRMKTARAETDRYYTAIINRVESDHLAGIPICEAFIKDLNAIIERYKTILAQEIGEHTKPLDE
jgi:hypothetical protein